MELEHLEGVAFTKDDSVSALLLSAGADASAENMLGRTPAFHNSWDASALKKHGKSVRDNLGQIALHAAVRDWYHNDDHEIPFTEILSRDLAEARDHHGQTVLHAITSGYGHTTVPCLVSQDYAAQDHAGQTLLHFAVAGVIIDISSYDDLIAKSDVQHRASNGQTSLNALSARERVIEGPYALGLQQSEELQIAAELIKAGARYCLALYTCMVGDTCPGLLSGLHHLSGHDVHLEEFCTVAKLMPFTWLDLCQALPAPICGMHIVLMHAY